ARQTGGQVFSGGCYEFERRLPYQALADAIRPVLARLHPDDCAALPGWMLAELRRLVPDWKAAPAAPPAATEPDILFHALYRFLAQLAGTAPVLLIVDDLHWANEATLSLLHYLARHGRQSPLLILCAHREATPPSLTTFHQQLQQAGLADAITLARLSPVGVQSLVRQLVTDADTAVPLAGYLFTETEGNPFFLAEMLKSLQENGILTRQDGRWQIDVSRLTPAILPGSIKTAVAHRLHRLPPAAQTLAGVTAVLGRACHYDLLHTVWPQDKEAMLAGLDDLLRAQILREADEWDYAFTHHKIQEAIYDDLPRHRRLHLHAQAGRALAQMADAQPAELAHHLAQGAKVDKSLVAPAAAAIFRAGEQAAAQFAYADALDYFKRALDLTPDHDQDRQFELLLARENARHILADRQAQAADLDRLDSLTPRLTVSQQIEAALRRSRFSHATGDYAAAIAAAQTAVHLAAEQGHTSLEAEGYWRWGMALRAQSSSKPAQRQLEKALNLARKAALPKLEAQCWRNLGLVSVDLGDYAAAKTHYAQSLRIFRRLGLHRREAQTLGNVSIIHRSEGDYAQAQRYLEQALQVFRQIGDRYQEGIVLLNLGVILWDQSDLPQGRAYLEDSLQICREIEDRSGAALALNNLGRLIAEQGNYPTATDYLNRALTIYDQIDERKGESITWQSLGNVRAAQGAYDDAVANYRQALAIRRGIGDRRGEGYCLRGLGDNALAIREYALAGESFTGALAIFREIGEQRGVGETLRGLGAWAASLGAFEQARDYFEQALQLFHSPRDEATVYAPLADLWRQMGDDQAAMAYGRRALEAAQAVGNRSVQAAALTHLGTAQLSLEQPGAAESVLQEALDLRRALSQPHLETEPLAGLARAALRRGDVPAAAQLAELILERVETYGLHGVAHPVRVYLACYHVWQTAHDSRAGAVLAAANTWLQSQANQIQDDDLRRSFLHNIPAHQALLTLF
ncbi:MAG: tetratricopeptide repeat protein, partial [Anaerolineae bacterium]